MFVLWLVALLPGLDADILQPTDSPIEFPDYDGISSGKLEVPLTLIQQLNKVTNVSELFDKFIEPEPQLNETSLATRIRQDEPMERKGLWTPMLAACVPEIQAIPVPLPPERDATLFYYPSCTRVERCGGCCLDERLSCQPVSSETLQLIVFVSEYVGEPQLQFKNKEIVEVEKHIKCKCDCKVKAEDCKPYQKYSKESCSCDCANKDKEHKCLEESDLKLWNRDECACVCRAEQECSTGFYFDTEIPLAMIQNLNKVSNVSKLFDKFVKPEHQLEVGLTSVGTRIGPHDKRRNSMPSKMAVCMPKNQTVQVPLRIKSNKTIFYYPSCVRVERCGGCCSHELLSCQPVSTENLQLTVLVTEYHGGNQLKLIGKEIVEVERHTKCRCDCKYKAEDCDYNQMYKKDICTCVCTNKDVRRKCLETGIHFWNPTLCSCFCINVMECSTGTYFDAFKCKCTKNHDSLRKMNTDVSQFSYNVGN